MSFKIYRMKGLLIPSCFFCWLACSSQTASNRFDSLLKRYEQLEQLNGTVLVAENGLITYQRAFGKASFEWQVNNTTDTKFRIASVSKLFTVILCFQLFEEKRLSPSTTLNEWLPEFKNGAGITIQQLLTHTSGLIDHREMRHSYDQKFGRSKLSREQLLAIFKDSSLLFPPGSSWHYSNFGYNILAIVLEKLTGKKFNTLLSEKIFRPAGMLNTSTLEEKPVIPKLSQAYERGYAKVVRAEYYDASAMVGAGSIVTTGGDLLRFLLALKRGQLVSPASLAKLYGEKIKDENGSSTTYNTWFFHFKTGKADSTEIAYFAGNHFGTHALVYDCYQANKQLVFLLNVRSQKLFEIADKVLALLFRQPVEMPKDSYVRIFAHDIEKHGVKKAVAMFKRNKKRHGNRLTQSPRDLNRLGYYHLEEGNAEIAIYIFKLNLEYYPDEADFYDSLGEAYLAYGDKINARIYLTKSLELNPKNDHARELLSGMKE